MLCWPYEAYLNKQVEERRRQASLQKAELERLLREAGIDQRGGRTLRRFRLALKVLSGSLRKVWRLERYGTPVNGPPLKSQAI